MQEVKATEYAHQPVEPLKVIVIQVAAKKPWCVPISTGDIIDN